MAEIEYGQEWITVVNRAMVELAREPLDSLDDITDPVANARIRIALPQAVSHVLALHPWKAMTRLATLSPLEGEGGDGWNVFAVPTDLVRVVTEYSDSGWRMVSSSRIVSEADAVTLSYVHAPQSPKDMPPSLLNAVASYLAYLLSQALAGSTELASLAAGTWQADFDAALREDAASDTMADTAYSWWQEVR